MCMVQIAAQRSSTGSLKKNNFSAIQVDWHQWIHYRKWPYDFLLGRECSDRREGDTKIYLAS